MLSPIDSVLDIGFSVEIKVFSSARAIERVGIPMKNCCSWLPEATAIAGVAIGAGVAFKGWPNVEGQTWAAWVQAVGSVGAILVAVWVAHDQHRKAEARALQQEVQELRNFLSGVREELRVHWEIYQEQVGNDLDVHKEGMPFLNWWPLPVQPFKFYRAGIEKIGKLKSDGLRRELIRVNVVVEGLLATYQTHNSLLDAYQNRATALRESESEPNRHAAQEAEDELIQYSKSLLDHHRQAKRDVSNVDALISSELK